MSVRFYQFEDFTVDVTERTLRWNGDPVVLTPKVFDMLVVLLENRGKTMEKDALIRAVWADTHVEEGSLNRCISSLRRALGDDSNEQRLIKTLPKLGYRFTDRVIAVAAEPPRETSSAPPRRFTPGRRELAFTALLAVGVVLFLTWTISSREGSQKDMGGLPEFERRQLESSKSSGSDAVEDYVKGRSHWHTRSAEGLYQKHHPPRTGNSNRSRFRSCPCGSRRRLRIRCSQADARGPSC